MGSKIGQKIGYDGVGALRGQRQIPSKHLPKYPPARVIGTQRVKRIVCPIKSNGFAVIN